jgi:ketopantoate reductase
MIGVYSAKTSPNLERDRLIGVEPRLYEDQIRAFPLGRDRRHRGAHTPGSTQSPSMFRDLQQGSPIEADQIIGDLLTRGAKAGIPTPLLAAAYANMSVYQDGLAQS